MLASRVGPGADTVAVVDGSGRYVLPPRRDADPASEWEGLASLPVEVNPIDEAAVPGDDGRTGIVYYGARTTAAYTYFAPWDWLIVSEVSEGDVVAEMRPTRLLWITAL